MRKVQTLLFNNQRKGVNTMSRTRANGEGNIRQRTDGRWEVRVTIGIDFSTGEPKRISRYASTQEEAVKILHETSFLRDTTPKNFQTITLGEWLDLCLEVYMKNSLKQSTYLSYESYIRVHLKPALGDVQLRDLTPRLLQQYYNYKAESEGLAPKTIVNINLFLHKALTYAVTEGYINSNPAASINLSRGNKPQIEILTRDEQARLIRASYRHRYGVFVRLVLFTGLRLGELLGLQWGDLDIQSGMLHIQRTLNRLNKVKKPTAPGENSTEIVIQEPKTKNSIRTVPLLPQVIQDLMTWRNVQRNDQAVAGDMYCDSGMIVTNPFGSYIEPRTFKDQYNQILKLAGLGHFTFHALRHTFASRAMEQGMDAKTLSVILGHASVSFTMDTYAHVLTDYKKENMTLMEELFDMGQPVVQQETSYPVITTTQVDGTLLFQAPDFPGIEFTGTDMGQGLQVMKEQIQEEKLVSIFPIVPTPPSQISLQSNQFLLQIPV